MNKTPTQAQIQMRFDYCASGNLIDIKTGKTVGAWDKRLQRVRVRVGTATYPLDKLIWCYHNGEFPSGRVSHVNGDAKDCMIENPEVKDHVPGAVPGRVPKSGIKGVQLFEELDGSETFKVLVYHGGAVHYGGYFKDKAMAIQKVEEMRYRLDCLEFKRKNKLEHALWDFDNETRRAQPGDTLLIQNDSMGVTELQVPRSIDQIRVWLAGEPHIANLKLV